MTDQQNSAPAVWDPTARGGAGGWVRGPQPPSDTRSAPEAPVTPTPQPPATAQPPAPGAVGDQGPPLGARPYLASSPGYDPPTAPLFPGATPPPPAAPPAPFPSPGGPQARAPQPAPGQDYLLKPPAAPPQPPYAAQPSFGAQPPYGTPGPYGAQPDRPAGYEEDEDRPTNRKAPLLIGFAVLLVLAIGGGLLFAVQGGDDKDGQAAPAPASAPATGADNPPPAPAPTGADGAPSAAASASGAPSPTATGPGPTARTQAQALDGLLSEGENAKAPIGNAVAKVTSCPPKADIEAAAQVFDSGASQRAGLLAKLSQLSVTDVPGGADAVNSLKSAWQLSADIDKAYASWARAVATQGCTGRAPATPDKKHADELNPQATQAKTDFMNKWNPIAKNYGLTPRTQDRI
ncbi:hypothetical protein ACWD4P_26170 [Kitasatospora sp. NPDC002543]